MIASPFDPPHPLARRAAEALQAELRAGLPGVDLSGLETRYGGKMFGVLVVEGAAPLRAFSGMLGGRWLVPGFAPPLFDPAARDAFWPAGEAAIRAFDARLRTAADEERAELRRRRRELSRALGSRLLDLYVIPSASGAQCGIRELFSSFVPGGAADCAAPKLLAEAYRRAVEPLALAEFWWGAAPPTGGRTAGELYPACLDKCGPVLRYMMT